MNLALADQATISGTNFLMGILLARHLGLKGFGSFTLAWMTVLFIQAMQSSLTSSPMMSIGPQQEEADMPAYFGAVLIQQLIVSLLSFLLLSSGLLLSLLIFPKWGFAPLFWSLIMASLAFPMQDFIRRYFFTRNQYAVAIVGDAITYLGQLGLFFLLAFTDKLSVSNVLWVITFTSTVAIIYGAFYMKGLLFERAVFYSTTKRHWAFSKWFIGATLSEWLYGNVFIIAAGNIIGVSAVGALKAAQNIVAITHILFKTLENIVPIKAAQHYKIGKSASLNLYLKKITLLSAFPIFTALILAFVFPSFLLDLVFGSEYQKIAYILQWYAIIYMIMFLWLPFRWGLQTLEHTKYILYANIIATTFTITTAHALTASLGLTGTLAGILTVHIILFITLRMLYSYAGKQS